MDELDRLLALAEAMARTGQRLTRAFTAELTRVARALERALSRQALSMSSVVALRGRIRSLLGESGYDALVAAAAKDGIDAWASLLRGRAVVPHASLDVRLRAFQQVVTVDLFAQGDAVATSVWRAMAQAAFLNRPVQDVLAELAQRLDRDVAQVATLFDTQMSVLGRQVEAVQTADLGPGQPYLYVGPIDGKTREWCLERVGQVFSRSAIDDLDNGQLPNTFLTGGGYNCRHVFLAVESLALRRLTNTGEVAPGYGAEVARVRAWKAAQKRKAA